MAEVKNYFLFDDENKLMICEAVKLLLKSCVINNNHMILCNNHMIIIHQYAVTEVGTKRASLLKSVTIFYIFSK